MHVALEQAEGESLRLYKSNLRWSLQSYKIQCFAAEFKMKSLRARGPIPRILNRFQQLWFPGLFRDRLRPFYSYTGTNKPQSERAGTVAVVLDLAAVDHYTRGRKGRP